MNLDSFKVGNKQHASKTSYAIADTGTSLLYMTQTDYMRFQNALTRKISSWDCSYVLSDGFPCYMDVLSCNSYYSKMPDLTVTLNGNSFTIPPEGYVLSGMSLEFGVGCVVAVVPISDSIGLWILGDTFLRNYATVFNYANNTISFAVNIQAP